MARPKIEIDFEALEKLCRMQATQEEVAAWFSCSVDTIDRAVKSKYKIGFADYSKQKREAGRISLRRSLWNRALDPKAPPALLIFALKNYCGMKDQADVQAEVKEPIKLAYKV